MEKRHVAAVRSAVGSASILQSLYLKSSQLDSSKAASDGLDIP